MKFFHPYYEIEVDTDDLKLISLIGKLKEEYKKIPNTKCLNCPGKCGVEADCCKVFSPPMLFIEFISILRNISKLPKEELKKIHYQCFESYLNSDLAKPCMLLKENLCSVYNERPLSCRLFGLYPQKEYNERLDRIQKELDIDISEIPFNKQCENIKSSGQKAVQTETSKRIHGNMHDIDVQLFDNPQVGSYFVYNTQTYLPFDAHWLLLHLGAEKLQDLTVMKLNLMSLRDKLKAGEIDKDQVLEAESHVKEFLSTIKKSIDTMNEARAETE